MLLAIYLSADFEVVIAQDFVTVETSEASRVEFRTLLSLEIWPLNAMVTLGAQGVIELVVMVLAIRIVVDNVKVCSCKR